MGRSKRVLIIDDDELIAEGLHSYLKLQGRAVEAVRDYESAKKKLRRKGYGAALVEILITGHSAEAGIDFLRWLTEAFPSTDVVVLTAYGTPRLEIAAQALGVNLFVEKPASFEEINNLITRLHADREEILQ